MAFAEKLNLNWKDASGTALLREISLSGDGKIELSVDLLDTQADLEVDLVLDVSEITLLYMVANVVVTLETNNGAAPTDTIVFVKDTPIMFYTGGGYAIGDLFTADITTNIFLTTSGVGTGAKFELRSVYNATV